MPRAREAIVRGRAVILPRPGLVPSYWLGSAWRRTSLSKRIPGGPTRKAACRSVPPMANMVGSHKFIDGWRLRHTCWWRLSPPRVSLPNAGRRSARLSAHVATVQMLPCGLPSRLVSSPDRRSRNGWVSGQKTGGSRPGDASSIPLNSSTEKIHE